MQGEEQLLQIGLIDPQSNHYSLRLQGTETPAELKNYLNDFAPTSFYTKYTFQTQGRILDDFVDYNDQGIESGTTFRMVLAPYDERTMKEILKSPPSKISSIVVNNSTDSSLLIESGLQTSLEALDLQHLLPNPSRLVENPSKLPPLKPEQLMKRPLPQCIKDLRFSEHHPPSSRARLNGDLAYLSVTTLEGHRYNVTGHIQGFFVNSFANESHKNPKQSEIAGASGRTLPELLSEISQSFTSAFRELLESGPESELRSDWRNGAFPRNWLYDGETAQISESEFDSIRDWNEELQMVRQLPADTPISRIQKDKALAKVYNDFLEAALLGTEAVVRGALQPLNPMDPKRQHVFVSHHIFFSFTEDIEYAVTYTQQEQGPEACATNVSANHDLRSLKFFSSMELPDLHYIATAIVDWRGYRVLCQSILPGILNQAPEQSCKYGSMDDGKTIHNDEGFHEIMKQVCQKLHLKSSEILDGEGNKFEIYGAFDTKGILGSDQRKYFLESFRLTPRDVNYQGEEFSLCLVRPELIEQYQQSKNSDFIDTHVQSIIEQKRAEGAEEAKITIEELENLVSQAPRYEFNPNVFTTAKLAENQEQAQEDVTNLSKFLLDSQVPTLVNAILKEEGIWSRLGISIPEVFHRYGVNMRYLGKVAQLIESEQHKHIRWSLERHTFARAAKHVLNSEIRECPDNELAKLVAHLLNCIFNIRSVNQEEVKEVKRKKKRRGKKQEVLKVNLINVSKPAAFEYSAEVMWRRVQEYCLKHFDLRVPSSIEDWQAVNLPGSRLALLREICIQTGITLDPAHNFDWTDSFTPDIIAEMVPRVKKLEWKSMESRWLYDTALRALREQNGEVAIDMLRQSANIQAQITGPYQADIAQCYARLSNLYFNAGDYTSSIQLQHKAIQTLEVALGKDHSAVAHQYLDLAYKYQALGKLQRTHLLLLHALQILLVNNGEYSNEVISVLVTIGVLYREIGQHETTVMVMNHVYNLYVGMYGEQHIGIAECAQIQAAEYKKLKEFELARERQEKALEVLTAVLPEEDPRIKECREILETIGKDDAESPAEQVRSPRTMDKNTFLRQRLQAKKKQAKMNIPKNQLHNVSPNIYNPTYNMLSRQQIEQERERQFLEEISKKANRD